MVVGQEEVETGDGCEGKKKVEGEKVKTGERWEAKGRTGGSEMCTCLTLSISI